MRVLLISLLVTACHEPQTDQKTATEASDDTSQGAQDSGNSSDEADETTPPDGDDTGHASAEEETGNPVCWPGSDVDSRQAEADAMVAAAQAFLDSLDDYQRGQVQYGLTDDERSDWSNLPHSVYIREGVSISELSPERLDAAWALISTSLSAAGLTRAEAIMQMEELLWDDGDMDAVPGKYFFTMFDEPSSETPWGWQLDGHHLALNFTVSGAEVTLAPSLWGTTPKTWSTGVHAGLTPMGPEEDLAFAWFDSLGEEQRQTAQLGEALDPDLMAGPTSVQEAWPDPEGIPVSSLTASQRAAVLDWIAVYVGNLPASQAAERMSAIETTLDDVSIAWMGGTRPGEMMYYRIQGPRVLIEFDHTQTADHMHAVYRDPQNDYGSDWLRKHLAEHH